MAVQAEACAKRLSAINIAWDLSVESEAQSSLMDLNWGDWHNTH